MACAAEQEVEAMVMARLGCGCAGVFRRIVLLLAFPPSIVCVLPFNLLLRHFCVQPPLGQLTSLAAAHSELCLGELFLLLNCLSKQPQQCSWVRYVLSAMTGTTWRIAGLTAALTDAQQHNQLIQQRRQQRQQQLEPQRQQEAAHSLHNATQQAVMLSEIAC
jgi:hypothetical protein